MDTVIDKKPAIMLDFTTWQNNKSVLQFVVQTPDAHVVLLVNADETYEWLEGDPDFQAVIRNNGKMDDLTFKTAALCLVQDSGTLVPSIAIDYNPEVRKMYRDGGVVVVFNEHLNVELERGEYFDAA